MSTLTAVASGNPIPSFPAFLASRIPEGFLKAARPLIEASYEEAFQGEPADGELPYKFNLQPHSRNKLVFEQLHQLAEGLGMQAIARQLDNTYHYLEIESNGLVIHVKHRNNYQSLTDQMVKADYRRQMTNINLPFGQLPLFTDGKPIAVPEKAYVILFYDDSTAKKSEVADIYFILPSNEEGNQLAYSNIENVLACYSSASQQPQQDADDKIDLPPHDDGEDAQEEAK